MSPPGPKSQVEEVAKKKSGFDLLVFAAGLLLTFIAAREAWTVTKLQKANASLQQQLGALEKTESENAELRTEQLRLEASKQKSVAEVETLRGEIRLLQENTNQQRLAAEFLRQQNLRLEEENQDLLARANGKPSVPRIGAWLGISIETSGDRNGVVVKSVAYKSPAALARMEEGDTIEAVDGSLVPDAETFKAIMAQKTGGQVTVLDVVRDSGALRMEVMPVDWPQ